MIKENHIAANYGYVPVSKEDMDKIKRMSDDVSPLQFTPNNRKARRSKKNKVKKIIITTNRG